MKLEKVRESKKMRITKEGDMVILREREKGGKKLKGKEKT